MEKLFIYGTLQYPKVQMAILKRFIKGTPDTLKNFTKRWVTFDVNTVYPMIVAHEGGSVVGKVVEVTTDELALLDRYETSAYRRIKVTLKSGNKAWVYCK